MQNKFKTLISIGILAAFLFTILWYINRLIFAPCGSPEQDVPWVKITAFFTGGTFFICKMIIHISKLSWKDKYASLYIFSLAFMICALLIGFLPYFNDLYYAERCWKDGYWLPAVIPNALLVAVFVTLTLRQTHQRSEK